MRWRNRDLFKEINKVLLGKLSKLLGRHSNPSAGIINSQSIKTTEKKGSVDLMEVKKLKVGKDTYRWITLDC